MSDVKVRLLKPLDRLPEGTETTFDKLDAERLRDMGAVEFVKAERAPDNKMAKAPANKAKG